MPSPFDLEPYRALRKAGATPQQALLRCIQDGHERIEVWWMLREVYGFDQALCKAAWLDAQGIAILPEYKDQLDRAARESATSEDDGSKDSHNP